MALFAAAVQFVTLRPLLGPFIYADELGYVAAARYFGPGYPEVQLQSGFFHAGYGLLLAPLTVVFREPESFHRAATSLNGLMIVVAAVLASRLLRRLLDLTATETVVTGSLFAVTTSAMIAPGLLWAESSLILLVALLATLARRVVDDDRPIDTAAVTLLGVAGYLLHPRAIAVWATVVLLWVLLGWRRGHWARSSFAIVALLVGFFAVRQLHELTADRLFAGSALTGANSSFRYRLEEFVFGAPGAWTRGLLGLAWYQLLASAGLIAVALTEWGRASWQIVATKGAASSLSERNVVGLVLLVSTLLTWLISGTITSGDAVRIDHTIYGRYLDHIAPLGVATAAAIVMRRAGPVVRPMQSAVVLVPLLGVVVTLWWGIDFYGEPRPIAPINAPVHATLTRVLDNNLPAVIGVAGGVGVALVTFLLWRAPRQAIVLAVPILLGLGYVTVKNEVRPQSRDTVNLRAMAEAVEAADPEGSVMIAEPFAFLNLYAGQYWADDVQFVLSTECPAQETDLVIAAIDDERYADHTILFTDPRSERQLLQVSPVGGPSAWAVRSEVTVVSTVVRSGASVPATIVVTNLDDAPLDVPGSEPRPVTVAYRLIEEGTAPYDTSPVGVPWSGRLEPGASVSIDLEIPLSVDGVALEPGRYEIVADLWVSRFGWLNEAGCAGGLPDGTDIEIVASS